MQQNVIYPIKSDLLFHDLINRDNIVFIKWIVTQVLNIPIKEVHGKCQIVNTRIPRINNKDRIKYVDTIIKYQEYEIILELNRNFRGSFIRNIVYGMTRIVGFYKRYKSKNKNDYQKHYYKDKLKVIVVNLNWYPEDKKNIKTPLKRINKVFGFDDVKKGIFFKVINITLDKYANMPYNEVKKSERFYKLLTIDNMDDLDNFRSIKQLEGYLNRLIEFCKDSKYKEDIMTEEMDRYFMEMDAFDAGIDKGIEQEKKNIVLNMFNKKFDLKTISDISKLSISKIKEIIKANKEY